MAVELKQNWTVNVQCHACWLAVYTTIGDPDGMRERASAAELWDPWMCRMSDGNCEM